MTDLEKQTLRAELTGIISKCQSVLLWLETPTPATEPRHNGMIRSHKNSTTAMVRQWLIDNRSILQPAFSTTQVKEGASATYPDANRSVISVALRNITIKGNLIEFAIQTGKGSHEPNSYRFIEENKA